MADPKLCEYCGIVIDSGMVCETDGEFNHCPAGALFFNGLTESETSATASVFGLVAEGVAETMPKSQKKSR